MSFLVRQHVEPITWLFRLNVKATLQVNLIYPLICICSKSPEPFERFSSNFIQIYLLIRWCAKHKTNLPRLKVKVTGQAHDTWYFPLNFVSTPYLLKIFRAIFQNFNPNHPLSETMCRTYDWALQTLAQGRA